MNGGHQLRPSEAKQLHRRTDGKIIQNDRWENDEEFIEFLIKAYKAALEVLKPGGAFYIWFAATQAFNFLKACKESSMQIRQVLVWNKNTFTLGRQDYQWKHEPCLYGWKDGAAHYFVDDRTQSTVIEEDKPSRSEEHPTMKPLKLLAKQIKNSTKPGENVLDIFGGSGSTLMACEQLGRHCFTAELDPRYCDSIIKRWEDFTGQQAVKINDEIEMEKQN